MAEPFLKTWKGEIKYALGSIDCSRMITLEVRLKDDKIMVSGRRGPLSCISKESSGPDSFSNLVGEIRYVDGNPALVYQANRNRDTFIWVLKDNKLHSQYQFGNGVVGKATLQ